MNNTSNRSHSSVSSNNSNNSNNSNHSNHSNNNNVENINTTLPDRDFNYVATDPSERAIAKGGVSCPFPWRLHEMLKVAEEEGMQHVVSWCVDGNAFIVRKPKIFAQNLMKRFFCQSKYASFQRQLNLYGFARITSGPEKGAYYNTHFVRGQRALVKHMTRRKVKGTRMQHKQQQRQPMEQRHRSATSSRHGTLRREVSIEENRESQQSKEGNEVLFGEEKVGFFEGIPFQAIEVTAPEVVEHATAMLALPWEIDPTEELAKLRAVIQQKRAEYEKATLAVSTASRRVSLQQHSSVMRGLDEFESDESDWDHHGDDLSDFSSIERAVLDDGGNDKYEEEIRDEIPNAEAVDASFISAAGIPQFLEIPVYKGSYLAV